MIDPGWDDFDSAEVLRHLSRLFGFSHADLVARSAKLGSQFALGKNFITNAGRPGAIPLQPHLYSLSRVFNLITGGAYRIFKLELDGLPELEHQINPSRTRLIESYAFFRDRQVYVPRTFALTIDLNRSAALSEWIEAWQEVPVRSLGNPFWHPEEFLYARLGLNDDTAYPDIPRGATIQTIPVTTEEALHPDSSHFYFMQHGHGYLCTRPHVERDLLHLPTSGTFYQGSHRLHMGKEARVLSRASSFFVSLPLSPAKQFHIEVYRASARIMPPWEQRSSKDLVADEILRSGVTIREGDEKATQIRKSLGFGISGKHAREIRGGEHPLHTASILALTPLASLRFQDVLRSENLMIDDGNRHSLLTLLRTHHLDQLPNMYVSTPMPRPAEIWSASRGVLYKWVMLLCHLFPTLIGPQLHWFYIHQSDLYRGLDSLVQPGSLLLTHPLDARRTPRSVPEDNRRDWERPIYLVRIDNRALCSYVYADANSLTLVPHPASGARPVTVERSRAQIMALVTGVFSLLP